MSEPTLQRIFCLSFPRKRESRVLKKNRIYSGQNLLAAKERKGRRENLNLEYTISGFSFEFFAFYCG